MAAEKHTERSLRCQDTENLLYAAFLHTFIEQSGVSPL